MSKIPAALQSPRNVDGVLHWYAGDTFVLDICVQLYDDSGVLLPFSENDTITFSFRKKGGEEVHRMLFTDIPDHIVHLDFNAETTAKFPAGSYTYDAVYEGRYRRTIAKSNRIVVG